MKRFLKGFTLAEVLITLGIIGVVAAVTLPSLQVNVNKQALSTQTSKVYSQLQEGLKLYMQNEGLDELDVATFDMQTFARNYLQVQYVCNNGAKDDACFAEKYTSISGSTTKDKNSMLNYSGLQAYILRDGQTIAYTPQGILKQLFLDDTFILRDDFVSKFKAAYVMDSPSTNMIAALSDINMGTAVIDKSLFEAEMIRFSAISQFIIDVNGKKGPNKIGYDLFTVALNADGSVGPSTASAFTDVTKREASIEKAFTSCKEGKDLGAGCFTHLLLNNFKFDY